jgi:endoglucanase
VLLGQPVLVHGQEETIPGLIGSRPPHVLPLEERKRYPAMHEFVVDTGISARRLAERVRVGDVITFDQPMIKLQNGRMAGKALDNRASVAALSLCLQELATREHQWDTVAAATVQEEVGLRGGRTVAWRIHSDLAIVVDVTFATGTSVSESDGAFGLGKGPTLAIGPTFHPRLFEMIQETAKALEITLHIEPLERASGTEVAAVQVSRDGIPTALLSIPLRNMHSPVEVVAPRDIERVARLMAGFIAGLNDKTLDRLALD